MSTTYCLAGGSGLTTITTRGVVGRKTLLSLRVRDDATGALIVDALNADASLRRAPEDTLRSCQSWYEWCRWYVDKRVRKRHKGGGHVTARGLFLLMVEQRFRCAVTGIEFDLSLTRGRAHPYAASVDRIDCARGYAPGNVRLVLLIANVAMNEWGEQTLVGFVRRWCRTWGDASPHLGRHGVGGRLKTKTLRVETPEPVEHVDVFA